MGQNNTRLVSNIYLDVIKKLNFYQNQQIIRIISCPSNSSEIVVHSTSTVMLIQGSESYNYDENGMGWQPGIHLHVTVITDAENSTLSHTVNFVVFIQAVN